ncbi:unnamed protein product [Linum tenue]|uniref:Fe2OG dioxygenase domain-containing protein n=2 Tax=Linum tenue TaxID=586396 RepID=A0AAV0HA40_9ROSI|nr:unnamed protein product [Linum tenue]
MKLTSVQELVKAAPRLSSIPLQFLQQTQTALSVPTPSSSAEIPTVDYTLLASPGSGETELQKLHSACKNWGIFQVTLASGLLGSMEEALEMEANEMAAKMDDGLQSVAIIYYPPCPQPELVLGFTPHSDATCITILSQVNGVGGLQVKTRDGSWVPVNILPNALVVLVGDILEVCRLNFLPSPLDS